MASRRPRRRRPSRSSVRTRACSSQAGNLIGTRPNSTQAEANFLALLSGVGTESFESFTDRVISPLGLTFPGAVTPPCSVAGVPDDDPGTGQAAVDGTKWWRTGLGNDFSITFSQPIAAFGFYGIDVGDINSQLTLTLVGGGIVNIPIPHSLGGAMNGSLIYFGYIDTANLFTSATFTNAGAGDDFGFDRMTIGSAQQVQPVPEPGHVAAPRRRARGRVRGGEEGSHPQLISIAGRRASPAIQFIPQPHPASHRVTTATSLPSGPTYRADR